MPNSNGLKLATIQQLSSARVGKIGRRSFLTTGIAGSLGLLLGRQETRAAVNDTVRSVQNPAPATRVGLGAGGSCYDNVLRALELVEEDVRRNIRGRQVVIKPNLVTAGRQLTSTHVDAVRAILDFLKPMNPGRVIVAESSAGSPAIKAYESYGYTGLVSDYDIDLLDLDREPYQMLRFPDRDLRPMSVRFSELALDPKYYVISAATMKTHDRAIATLSIKNLIVGSILKHDGVNDKRKTHQGPKGINYVLYALSQESWADLAVIDGFEGMEGDGPISGTPVPSRVAVAGIDPAAVDRIGLDLMGIDVEDVGYLTYLGKTGRGRIDRAGIEVRGQRVEELARKYRLNKNIEHQLTWKT